MVFFAFNADATAPAETAAPGDEEDDDNADVALSFLYEGLSTSFTRNKVMGITKPRR